LIVEIAHAGATVWLLQGFRAHGLPFVARQSIARPLEQEAVMGINTERDIEANLQIGPTDQGMVRLFIEADGLEIPMDFSPEEAEDIASEIMAAARAAQAKG